MFVYLDIELMGLDFLQSVNYCNALNAFQIIK